MCANLLNDTPNKTYRYSEITDNGLRGGGRMDLSEGFAEYLKNNPTDIHQTLRLLKQLYKSSSEIKNLGTDHSLLL